MIPSMSIDQLGGYSYLVSSLLNPPLYNIPYTQFLTNLLNLYRLALVCECRVSSNHQEPWNLAKGSNNLLSDPVAEIFLRMVATQVVKRQYSNGRFVWQGKGQALLGGFLHLRFGRGETELPECRGTHCHEKNDYQGDDHGPPPGALLWLHF